MQRPDPYRDKNHECGGVVVDSYGLDRHFAVGHAAFAPAFTTMGGESLVMASMTGMERRGRCRSSLPMSAVHFGFAANTARFHECKRGKRMKTEPIYPFGRPLTPNLEHLAAGWTDSPRPTIRAARLGQESVWDYPRQPAIQAAKKRATVWVNDYVIADSESCLRVLETACPPAIYFPAEDVDRQRLERLSASSRCEWKGEAVYYSIHTENSICERAAWSYAEPDAAYAELAGHFAFYPARVSRCTLGDDVVRPQAGGIYGGWITSNLVGPFKGEPGSGGW
jgi:uncharacterized protein (DUF427 family)